MYVTPACQTSSYMSNKSMPYLASYMPLLALQAYPTCFASKHIVDVRSTYGHVKAKQLGVTCKAKAHKKLFNFKLIKDNACTNTFYSRLPNSITSKLQIKHTKQQGKIVEKLLPACLVTNLVSYLPLRAYPTCFACLPFLQSMYASKHIKNL